MLLHVSRGLALRAYAFGSVYDTRMNVRPFTSAISVVRNGILNRNATS